MCLLKKIGLQLVGTLYIVSWHMQSIPNFSTVELAQAIAQCTPCSYYCSVSTCAGHAMLMHSCRLHPRKRLLPATCALSRHYRQPSAHVTCNCVADLLPACITSCCTGRVVAWLSLQLTCLLGKERCRTCQVCRGQRKQIWIQGQKGSSAPGGAGPMALMLWLDPVI
jgi:hypothetical protein